MHFNILRCRCPSHQLTTDIKIRILVNKIKTEQRKLIKLQKIDCSYRCSRIIIIITEIIQNDRTKRNAGKDLIQFSCISASFAVFANLLSIPISFIFLPVLQSFKLIFC